MKRQNGRTARTIKGAQSPIAQMATAIVESLNNQNGFRAYDRAASESVGMHLNPEGDRVVMDPMLSAAGHKSLECDLTAANAAVDYAIEHCPGLAYHFSVDKFTDHTVIRQKQGASLAPETVLVLEAAAV